jgi:hypothetical protein
MPRKAPDPAPTSGIRLATDDATRIATFLRDARSAGRKFAQDPEAGRREAVAATLRLLVSLTSENDTVAAFKSLLETHRPQRGGHGDPPWRWKSTARIAAATDGLMQMGLTEGAAAMEVLKVIEAVGFDPRPSRPDKTTYKTILRIRTRYLNGTRNLDHKDAPDPAAIVLFNKMRNENLLLVSKACPDSERGTMSYVILRTSWPD